MKNPFVRKPNVYEEERQRLLLFMASERPESDDYAAIVARLNEIDRMINRTSELKKTVIPALGTIGGVAGIYALQQFAGVIVPKALDAIASRSSDRKSDRKED